MAAATACAPRGAGAGNACYLNTLAALARASRQGPAGVGEVIGQNPVNRRGDTLRALELAHEAGLAASHPHPLSALLDTWTLTPAGQAWLSAHL